MRSVQLPRGLFDDAGGQHREVRLRALSGREEALLGDASDPPAALLTTLLVACVEGVGRFAEIDERHAAALSRGDRQILALALRAGLFGAAAAVTLNCPGCRGRSEVDLDLAALIPSTPPAVPERIAVESISVRPPSGLDDEWLERTQLPRAEKVAALWSRLCDHEWSGLSVQTRQRVALALAEESGAPDLAFLSRCPRCAATIEFDLDPLRLLTSELRLGARRLLAEVHVLGWSYGWSERDILDLPRARRWQYLELVRRQVEGRPLDWGGAP